MEKNPNTYKYHDISIKEIEIDTDLIEDTNSKIREFDNSKLFKKNENIHNNNNNNNNSINNDNIINNNKISKEIDFSEILIEDLNLFNIIENHIPEEPKKKENKISFFDTNPMTPELKKQQLMIYHNFSILLIKLEPIKKCQANIIISLDGFYKSFSQFYKKNNKNNKNGNNEENLIIEKKNEIKERKIKFAIYPIASTNEDGKYFIFAYILSVKMNSLILQNGLKIIVQEIQTIYNNKNIYPTISIDNGACEVSACNKLGYFFIICKFHLLRDWKKTLKNIKKNKIKEIKEDLEYFEDISKNKSLTENQILSLFLEKKYLKNIKKFEMTEEEKEIYKKNKKKKDKEKEEKEDNNEDNNINNIENELYKKVKKILNDIKNNNKFKINKEIIDLFIKIKKILNFDEKEEETEIEEYFEKKYL